MTRVINTSNLSLIAQNNINKNWSALSSSIERLSSGLRTNSAKDDAAGQVIINRFTSNIKGLTQAARNASDGISVAQTAEDTLSEINNSLQRIHELTVQAFTRINSGSNLGSVQSEIKPRLDEIDRIFGQTQFNGVNVLAKDGSMKIQVDANDGQTITIGLKKIDSDTLGLNGFNVNSFGTIANRTAIASDLTTAKMDAVANIITTANNALTASKTLDQLKDGDTVTTKTDAAQTATVYTYNASAGNFSLSSVSNNTSTKIGDVTASLLSPAGQTTNGVYKVTSGEANFDVDANGEITIGGQEAYLTSDSNLTTNDAGGMTAAMLDNLFKEAGDDQSIGLNETTSVTMRGTTYNLKTGADASAATTNVGVSFTDIASKEAVLDKMATAKQDTAVVANGDTLTTTTYKSGAQTYQVVFTAGDGTANAKYADNTDIFNAATTYTNVDGGMTTIGPYTTKYSIDANNDEVTVGSGIGTGEYTPKVEAEVYVSASGTLTTDTTSESTVTEGLLEALDEAISSIDRFHPSLGAIQNRLDSAATNLNNTTTNLSEVQPRIQGVSYTTEASNILKTQVIQQADNSVLAKANQVPQQVLSLLQD